LSLDLINEDASDVCPRGCVREVGSVGSGVAGGFVAVSNSSSTTTTMEVLDRLDLTLDYKIILLSLRSSLMGLFTMTSLGWSAQESNNLCKLIWVMSIGKGQWMRSSRLFKGTRLGTLCPAHCAQNVIDCK
jgi:hypothetical protein